MCMFLSSSYSSMKYTCHKSLIEITVFLFFCKPTFSTYIKTAILFWRWGPVRADDPKWNRACIQAAPDRNVRWQPPGKSSQRKLDKIYKDDSQCDCRPPSQIPCDASDYRLGLATVADAQPTQLLHIHIAELGSIRAAQWQPNARSGERQILEGEQTIGDVLFLEEDIGNTEGGQGLLNFCLFFYDFCFSFAGVCGCVLSLLLEGCICTVD